MFSDLKFTIRSLLKAPGFTAIAILTLALGIGATTAIFSVVNAVLLRPPPYVQPERLARIYTEWPSIPNGGLRRFRASNPEYLDLRREATAWEYIEGWFDVGVNIATANEPSRAMAAFVTGGMLHSLGVTAALGRIISPQDAEPGAPSVAVISHGLWLRAFGGEREIVGREILLNGLKCTIVGIMPEGFSFPLGEIDASEVWTPLQIDPAEVSDPTARDMHRLNLLGRLKPNITLRQAQAELDLLVTRWGQSGSGHRFDPENHTIVTYGLHDEVVRGVRPALRMLMGAVCFLLLIACVNVANLLLARAEARQQEIAIRSALGAGLWRLARQCATEGILLSLAGAAVGLLLAYGGLKFIEFAGEPSIPRAAEIGIDGRVVLFALTTSFLAGVAFGLAPLAHVIKRNLHGAMKSAAASTTGAAGAQRFRQILIVSQLALALILLTGTGLMLRAFWKLQQVDAGFDPKSVVTMSVGLSGSTHTIQDLWTRLEERLNALPGVESAALTTALPPARPSTPMGAMIEGYVPTEGGLYQPVEFFQGITRRYFNTLRIRPLEGRLFDERDGPQAPRVVVINQTMARTFWGNSSPVGHRMRLGLETDWRTVVGVIADVKNGGLEKATGTEVYFPYTQPLYVDQSVPNFVIRSQSNPSVVVNAVRRELKQIDSTLPLVRVRTMDEVVSASQSRHRFLALLLTLFASVALMLAAVGIYGVISYSTALRTKEFGIRMALGAQHGAVLGLVLRRGLLLTICGMLIGIAGAFALTRFLSGFLFGVTATDPVTFVVVSLLLGVIALVACYIPARRATKVDPLVALRTE